MITDNRFSTDLRVATLLDKIEEAAKPWSRETLSWKGTKVPRHMSFRGKKIGWAQHGILLAEDGSQIGTYIRTKCFAGPGKDEHEMEVTAS